MRLFITIYLSIFWSILASAQQPELEANFIDQPIKIDGELTESSWNDAQKADQFYLNFPYDSAYANSKTTVKVAFDDQFIYIAAICYINSREDIVVESLKRDFSIESNDAFEVILDPFKDEVNGYSFALNAYGAQQEGLIANGGTFGVSKAWDNKWYSAVKQYEDRWTLEMAIPYTSLKFKENDPVWNINFSRVDMSLNERSTWVPVPRAFSLRTLAFTGQLQFEKPPLKPSTNISLIPFVSGNLSDDYRDTTGVTLSPNAGLDARITVFESLNLDLTFNPDFSQVDVDQQVTNLSRFSIFFPERRNFFIENNDIFGWPGFSQIRPFFSRKIGLYQGSTVPILAGARLSGKPNKNWRIGLMNMQTEGVGRFDLKAQNYGVAAIQRQVFGRSTISGILVNRQAVNEYNIDYGDYNRVAGIDFLLNSRDSKWRGKMFYHHSFTPGRTDNSYAHASWVNYRDGNISINWNHEYVGYNYQADVGFVPRVDNYNPQTQNVVKKTYWRLEPSIRYFFFPESEKINTHGPFVYWSEYYDSSFRTTDRDFEVGYDINFQNTSNFSASGHLLANRLFFDTDVTFTDNPAIPAGFYKNWLVEFSYNSDRRKLLNYGLYSGYGTYYNGTRFFYGGDISFRKQPWGQFSFSYQQNELLLPDPYEGTFLTLIGPKIEFSFTNSLFFTTFIQYNTQINNININSRLQWRFKPMSDLFIVYTDNYDSNIFGIKNRALVVKLSYWFNV